MKTILGIIIFLIVAAIAVWLLPLAIGILVALFKFQDGNIIGGIIAIAVGLICEAFWVIMLFDGDVPVGGGDDDCPYCGSGDTDGNHCYTCDDDF